MEWAIIGVMIASVIASVVGTAVNASTTKKTNDFNEAQYEDWKEYNTPANQMARLSEAGLNPYMVNGVNNTLSQPFQVGTVSSVGDMFNNISSIFKGSASSFLGIQRNQIAADNAETNRINADTKITEARIHNRLADLRERMVKIAEDMKDPQMALLWGQSTAQDIGNQILSSSAQDIVNLRHYQALTSQENYDFITKMHPLQLDYYVPMQQARIGDLLASAALKNRQASHLSWYEQYMRDKMVYDMSFRNRGLIQDWNKFELGLGQNADQFNRRLSLSESYKDLADYKFMWDVFSHFIPTPKSFLKKATRGGAGQFPSWTEYEYGY